MGKRKRRPVTRAHRRAGLKSRRAPAGRSSQTGTSSSFEADAAVRRPTGYLGQRGSRPPRRWLSGPGIRRRRARRSAQPDPAAASVFSCAAGGPGSRSPPPAPSDRPASRSPRLATRSACGRPRRSARRCHHGEPSAFAGGRVRGRATVGGPGRRCSWRADIHTSRGRRSPRVSAIPRLWHSSQSPRDVGSACSAAFIRTRPARATTAAAARRRRWLSASTSRS